MRRVVDEDVAGTALAHLGSGLFEAHARDEAGFDGEGGHEHMWFAARDVAFENPVTEDQRALMLERMGIAPPGSGGKIDAAALRASGPRQPQVADDVDFDLESLIARMVRLLLIEISAFHTFAWAEELLADPDLVAGDGEAARLVSYIRADETPHVDYLRTALSELRDRTIVGEGGRKHAGADLVGGMWDRALALSIGPNRQAPSRPRGARCGTPSATAPAPPTCWPGSTSWARSTAATTAPGSRRPPRPDPPARARVGACRTARRAVA